MRNKKRCDIMLGLPHSTDVNRRIAKEKFYTNATLAPQVRENIKEQIEAVFWRNKIAESTMSVATGETVTEIHVFEINLRQKGLDKRVFSAVAKAIPYKILFVLVCGHEAQLHIEASGVFYHTEWLPLDEISLKFEGLNLDALYENLVRQISGGRLAPEADGVLEEAVARDKQRQKLEREIAALEKKLRREKQFNVQIEFNEKLKWLKKKLDELTQKRNRSD